MACLYGCNQTRCNQPCCLACQIADIVPYITGPPPPPPPPSPLPQCATASTKPIRFTEKIGKIARRLHNKVMMQMLSDITKHFQATCHTEHQDQAINILTTLSHTNLPHDACATICQCLEKMCGCCNVSLFPPMEAIIANFPSM